MPSKCSKWNLDPSLALGIDVGGTAAGGHDDRVVLPGFVGAGDWLIAAVAVGCVAGRRDCNSAVRDHSGGTGRKLCSIHWRNKTVAGEPLRHALPCLFTGGSWTTAMASWQVKTNSNR